MDVVSHWGGSIHTGMLRWLSSPTDHTFPAVREILLCFIAMRLYHKCFSDNCCDIARHCSTGTVHIQPPYLTFPTV